MEQAEGYDPTGRFEYRADRVIDGGKTMGASRPPNRHRSGGHLCWSENATAERRVLVRASTTWAYRLRATRSSGRASSSTGAVSGLVGEGARVAKK
ncbi:MAG: hypothetical protein IJM67_02650 [Atopobiaceae bacterium]|nr:hypothetical protein [Atopobiaceae bacterium]